MNQPYMPLMMGDWVQGTRGMRADVKGVYIGLLIFQYDHGYLPADVEDLQLIEPEVGKVWSRLESKFPLSVSEPGIRRNPKLEQVRAFWTKQKQNGKLGGRPRGKPNQNPNDNPNPNLQNELDPEHDFDLNQKKVSAKTQEDIQLVQWEEWGNLIVDNLDQYWHGMRGREISRQEMNEFLSVASRNSWDMSSQHKFRIALRGFDGKKGTAPGMVNKKRDYSNL